MQLALKYGIIARPEINKNNNDNNNNNYNNNNLTSVTSSVFRIQSNIYDGAFLAKIVNGWKLKIRPISCLPLMWKLMTRMTAESVDDHR